MVLNLNASFDYEKAYILSINQIEYIVFENFGLTGAI